MDTGPLSQLSIVEQHHLGIATFDAESTCGFYCAHLGFSRESVIEWQPQRVRVAILRRRTETLEILEPLDPDCATGRFLASRGPGMHHVCYAVEDIQDSLALLRRQGVPLVHDHVEQGLFGPVLFLHPKHAHGVMVELVQPERPLGSEAES